MEARRIRAKANGPWLVPGPLSIEVNGVRRSLDQKTVALCRCGGSSDKPFCDGTHKRNGFQGPEVVLHLAEGIATPE